MSGLPWLVLDCFESSHYCNQITSSPSFCTSARDLYCCPSFAAICARTLPSRPPTIRDPPFSRAYWHLSQNFLNKPDGGRGWASWFLEKGYQVYIVDEPTRGRSAWNPASGFPQSTFSAEFISSRFTAVQSQTSWPQAKLHTQWPGVSLLSSPITNSFNILTHLW